MRRLAIIRSDITSELVPMMGSEKQCEDLAGFMRAKFEEDPMQVWQYDIFGKQLYELVRENMESKLQKMPENVPEKTPRDSQTDYQRRQRRFNLHYNLTKKHFLKKESAFCGAKGFFARKILLYGRKKAIINVV